MRAKMALCQKTIGKACVPRWHCVKKPMPNARTPNARTGRFEENVLITSTWQHAAPRRMTHSSFSGVRTLGWS